MLIVDDNEPMRRALREFLQAAYPAREIREAADGRSALEKCARHRPRLVLLDVSLPDVNGIELLPLIRALVPAAVVIVVSQRADASYVERALAAGAAGYVVKDTLHRELLPAIEGALERQRRGRE